MTNSDSLKDPKSLFNTEALHFADHFAALNYEAS